MLTIPATSFGTNQTKSRLLHLCKEFKEQARKEKTTLRHQRIRGMFKADNLNINSIGLERSDWLTYKVHGEAKVLFTDAIGNVPVAIFIRYLRTENGRPCSKFHESCNMLGLLADGSDQRRVVHELFKSSLVSISQRCAAVLAHCNGSNSLGL